MATNKLPYKQRRVPSDCGSGNWVWINLSHHEYELWISHTGSDRIRSLKGTRIAGHWEVQLILVYPATRRPDHGRISEIAGYVNHHANRVDKVSLLALPFLFLSRYPSLTQIIVVFWPLQAWDGRNYDSWNSGIFKERARREEKLREERRCKAEV